MQTQCPHCDTRFRVTESQVNIADGFVRCSVCKEVFNAFEVADQHEHQQSLLNQGHRDELPFTPDTNNDTSSDTGIDIDIDLADNEEDLSEQAHTDLEPFEVNQAEENDDQNDLNSRFEKLNIEGLNIDDQNIEHRPETEAVDFNQTSATHDTRKDAFDFFDEEANESLPHVVPEKYKDAYTASSSTLISSLLWSAAILLLMTTLLIEYAWFNRDQLNQIPQMQTLTDKLCQQVDCKNISMRNPAKIELISRNVYSHPNEKNALMVNITMKNHADFAQPYPIMQIKFSDVRGGNVAARRFLPAEYLPEELQRQDSQQLQLLEPATNMTFTMEIQDPGKQAMTYEFDFL